jgi:hypothetical protein
MAEIQVRISDSKKADFKAACEANKDTMAEVIKKAIDEYINQNMKGGIEMTNLEIRSLIEETCMTIGDSVELEWDGGQDGHYYFKDSSMWDNKEFIRKSAILGELSIKVNEYLKSTNTQESDIWE